jgi:hypothetical protein
MPADEIDDIFTRPAPEIATKDQITTAELEEVTSFTSSELLSGRDWIKDATAPVIPYRTNNFSSFSTIPYQTRSYKITDRLYNGLPQYNKE